MNDSNEQHIDSPESSQTIRIELPLGAFSGLRRMMAGFVRPGKSEAGCCEPPMSRCCPGSDEGGSYEFTVTIGRKE